MKKVFLASIAALTASASFAADLPSRKGPPPVLVPPPPPLLWTGFYVGGNIGGGWLDSYNRFGWTGPTWDGGSKSGVVGGGQVGYNHQLSPLFVVGVETDFQGTGIGGKHSWVGVTRSVDWFGTLRGRIGVSVLSPQLLVYGTGGFAYGDIGLNYGWLGSLRQTGTGWTVGGGVEWAFLPHWSAKAEYLFTNIGAIEWGSVFAGPQRVHVHTARAGVNYHFDWAQPAPILARY
ncbi:MAG: porin [Methylocystaceae bacterium]|nr:MAG: porin [Methylocystaceae bacterium]